MVLNEAVSFLIKAGLDAHIVQGPNVITGDNFHKIDQEPGNWGGGNMFAIEQENDLWRADVHYITQIII